MSARTKQTELPSGWVLKELSSCCWNKGSYGINASAVEYSSDLPRYLRITDIDDEGNFSNDKMVSVNNENSSDFILENGDIVFVRTGSTVGKTYLYNTNDGVLIYAGFLIKFKVNNDVLLPKYLSIYTQTKKYWNWVKTASMRSGQPGINAEEIGAIKIPLPPLSEQCAIANIISTWDTAIQTTQALISQKEQEKKWLMQNLLTGKKRLNGFSGEWKDVKIGDVTTKFSRKNKDLIDCRVYSVTNSNGFVLQSDHFSREVAGDNLTGYKIIKKGEFAYNPARINVGSIAYFNDEIGIISSLYVCFSTNEEILDYFLEQIFKLDLVKHRIEAFGEGGVRVYLWYELFEKIKISIPTIEEQSAIAQVLQTADKEIELLKTKLEQQKLQKKGLIQVLLTGKIRIKAESPSALTNK